MDALSSDERGQNLTNVRGEDMNRREFLKGILASPLLLSLGGEMNKDFPKDLITTGATHVADPNRFNTGPVTFDTGPIWGCECAVCRAHFGYIEAPDEPLNVWLLTKEGQEYGT